MNCRSSNIQKDNEDPGYPFSGLKYYIHALVPVHSPH
eukprot:UN16955